MSETDSPVNSTARHLRSLQLYTGAATIQRKAVCGIRRGDQQKLPSQMHDSTLGGHSGQQYTYTRSKKIFYWPRLKSDAERIVGNCTVCIQNKFDNQPYISKKSVKD